MTSTADEPIPTPDLFDGAPPPRDEYVLGQGFPRDLEYCRSQLPDPRMWAPELDDLPEANYGRHQIARRDLFAIAERAAADPGDPWAAIQLHAAIVFWGAPPGQSTHRAALPLAESKAPQHLTEALRTVRTASAQSAYQAMDRYQRLWISGLGASYFTKFMYFGGYNATKPGMPQPLIMDDNVLKALRDKTQLPWANTVADYMRYLDAAKDWAFDYNTTPDVIERRLFQLGS